MIHPQPKPRPQLHDRLAEKRAADLQERQFKLAVWLRDGGQCRACQRKVIKTIDLVPNRGEIHHRRGRNVAPEDRFNVARALLLCAECHRDPAVVARFRR